MPSKNATEKIRTWERKFVGTKTGPSVVSYEDILTKVGVWQKNGQEKLAQDALNALENAIVRSESLLANGWGDEYDRAELQKGIDQARKGLSSYNQDNDWQ